MSQNPYSGINAHINSLLQTPGTPGQPAIWPSFHSRHVAHLADFLNMILPEQYVAHNEQSLQVRGSDFGSAIRVQHPKPDISVTRWREDGEPVASDVVLKPSLSLSLDETVDLDDWLKAVIVRRVSSQTILGDVVLRIELLSSTNKPGGSGAALYRQKRFEALQTGIPLIEIDYLHETPSPLHNVPVYPHDDDAKPYYVAISDPRPSWQQGQVNVYQWSVRDPLPQIPVLLADDDTLIYDLNPVYQHTFTAGRWHHYVDYTHVPVRWTTYHADDQAMIQTVMTRVI